MTFFDYVSLVAAVEKRDETASGKVRDGLTVECLPVLGDPQVVQRQSRVACLAKPYQACTYCQHSSFEVLFNANKEKRFEQVSCPRWSNPAGRILGQPPDGYVSVEMATCADGPFEFCPSCPSQKNVAMVSADKSVPGWYGRWRRLREAEREEGDDG